jgi:hypothetical protein
MTTNKDFKRLVRARMRKTGEAYTAARVHILEKPRTDWKPAPANASIDYAALARMSDRTLQEKTGCNWERYVGAAEIDPPRMARRHDRRRLVDAEGRRQDRRCHRTHEAHEQGRRRSDEAVLGGTPRCTR